MGGLINTKGTIALRAHFNDEFSTYLGWYRNLQAAPPGVAPAYTLFDSSGWPNNDVDLLAITNWVTDNDVRHTRRQDNLTLLPDTENHPKHVHLEARWRWFLNVNNANANNAVSKYALAQTNHNLIAADILYALQGDTSYNSINFDVIENTAGQTVSRSTINDSVNATPVKILQILLTVTGPIPLGPVAAVAPATPLPALDGPPY